MAWNTTGEPGYEPLLPEQEAEARLQARTCTRALKWAVGPASEDFEEDACGSSLTLRVIPQLDNRQVRPYSVFIERRAFLECQHHGRVAWEDTSPVEPA